MLRCVRQLEEEEKKKGVGGGGEKKTHTDREIENTVIALIGPELKRQTETERQIDRYRQADRPTD